MLNPLAARVPAILDRTPGSFWTRVFRMCLGERVGNWVRWDVRPRTAPSKDDLQCPLWSDNIRKSMMSVLERRKRSSTLTASSAISSIKLSALLLSLPLLLLESTQTQTPASLSISSASFYRVDSPLERLLGRSWGIVKNVRDSFTSHHRWRFQAW